MSIEGQTTEEVQADRDTMNKEMDAAAGIEPAKEEAGQEDKTAKAEPTGDEAGKSAEPTDGDKSGEVDPNVTAAKKGTEPGVQKRFNEMTAKNSALKEDAAYWQGRAEAAEAKGKPDQAEVKTAEEPVAKKELDPDDFESHEDYTAALVKQGVDEGLAAKEKKDSEKATAKTETEKTEKAAQRTYEQGLKATEKYEDFGEVVTQDNPNLNLLPQNTAQMVLDSEFGADLAYQIGKDPELATRLSKMTKEQAYREIVKLELPLEEAEVAVKEASGEDPPKEPDVKTKRVSAAPAPVGALGSGSGVGKNSGLSDDASMKDWMDARNEVARMN